MRPSRHPQVRVRDIEVDELLAPLLEALWDHGYETVGSCQEFRPGTARIWFRNPRGRDALKAAASWAADVSGDHYTVDFLKSEIGDLAAFFTLDR